VKSADVAWVTLALVPGIGRVRFNALLAVFGEPAAVLAAPIDQLCEVHGISRAAATAIRSASLVEGERVVRRTEDLGGTVLTPDAPAFPRLLRAIPEAPTLLFAKGSLELLGRPAVAIVGSRMHSRYGEEVCRHFARGLARAGLMIVSGMARGLDAVAHHACLDARCSTVGVLGNGLGVVYPAANRALYDRVEHEGCLLTEFPPGERPNAGSFPRRNRLISGLARAIVVIEACERSGALITVDCALAQGRDVFAVPGPITSPQSAGCNRLLQQGATPALTLEDVLAEYGIHAAPPAQAMLDLSERDEQVLGVLDRGGQSPDDVARALDCPVAEALALLTDLELRGAATCSPGTVFRRAVAAAGAG
jgi:DNA processing protein